MRHKNRTKRYRRIPKRRRRSNPRPKRILTRKAYDVLHRRLRGFTKKGRKSAADGITILGNTYHAKSGWYYLFKDTPDWIVDLAKEASVDGNRYTSKRGTISGPR